MLLLLFCVVPGSSYCILGGGVIVRRQQPVDLVVTGLGFLRTGKVLSFCRHGPRPLSRVIARGQCDQSTDFIVVGGMVTATCRYV
jgi:hypothetical protein